MSQAEPATARTETRDTGVGSVFVSNYPPYSFWSEAAVPAVGNALDAEPDPATPFGLYLHVPFCRKRCKFCYFRVYTGKNADEVGTYLDGLAREVELYAPRAAVAGRRPRFVYFGGGTPSFLSARQLGSLAERVRSAIPWEGAEEITFECEPGTLTRPKLEFIRELGVTRLSLGIESFDDEILRENGRAHVSKEIFRVWPWIQELDFPQVNVDLIAGMVGESWESWRETVAKTVDFAPDSVTVYQMELPYNTRFSERVLAGEMDRPLADWATKRAMHDHAFERLAAAGYEPSSAYTMVKDAATCRFVYRDSVWQGCDLLGVGVASFSHLGGFHFQNSAAWGDYLGALEEGELPIDRAFGTTPDERLTRETLLQLKRGHVEVAPLQAKFGVDILERFGEAFARLEDEGMLDRRPGRVELTRRGLLQVDALLPELYDPRYRGARYT